MLDIAQTMSHNVFLALLNANSVKTKRSVRNAKMDTLWTLIEKFITVQNATKTAKHVRHTATFA